MKTTSCELTLHNSFEELGRCNLTASTFLEKHSVSSKAIYTTNLVLEELISNTIRYGYDDDDEHEIRVAIGLETDAIIITIQDDGHAFNPVTAPIPEPARSLEDAPVGGRGIHLVRNMADALHYRRIGNLNTLEIRIMQPAR